MNIENAYEEWAVLVQQRIDQEENRWINAKSWYQSTSINDRYCKSKKEAESVLAYAYRKWNGKKIYNEKGERYESYDAGGGIGVSTVCTKDSDRRFEIINYKIIKRIVTKWETVEKSGGKNEI